MTAPSTATGRPAWLDRGGDERPVGFLGGSFDPVHAGHLQLARDAQRALDLAALAFVPAGRPWQKPDVSPAAERLRMLELAVQGAAGWSIDRREIERAGPTYTFDTVRSLRADAGPARPLVWIMGFDQLCRLPTWHRWEELLGQVHIAYAARADCSDTPPAPIRELLRSRAGLPADLSREAAGRIAEFPMQAVDCSATQIRKALAGGDAAYVRRCLPAPVLEHLRQHPLYGQRHGNEKTAAPGH
jgi:nicotinate-nucleotide adenylyltransferase